jgi:hypothetical protein
VALDREWETTTTNAGRSISTTAAFDDVALEGIQLRRKLRLAVDLRESSLKSGRTVR